MGIPERSPERLEATLGALGSSYGPVVVARKAADLAYGLPPLPPPELEDALIALGAKFGPKVVWATAERLQALSPNEWADAVEWSKRPLDVRPAVYDAIERDDLDRRDDLSTVGTFSTQPLLDRFLSERSEMVAAASRQAALAILFSSIETKADIARVSDEIANRIYEQWKGTP